ADAFSFLVGFELMSLASWALVLASHREAESREAAQIYLGMAAFGAACMLLCFGLLAGAEGDYRFAEMRAAPPTGLRASAVMLLALAGAGSKAGLFPLHIWLPLAHPAAPSHVSALMSGVMTKVALYALARVLFDLMGADQPGWWGGIVMAVGAASAVMGALRAVLERDGKTLLACSTIENVGLVAIGFGLALLFRGREPGLAALALGGAMLHALNHAIFKSGLFFVTGALLVATGSRAIDRMGGLIHRMPATALSALLLGMAMAALPPGNGFASEWLLVQAVIAAPRIDQLGFQVEAAVVAVAMAIAAALAAMVAVRFLGVAFLGRPRSAEAEGAVEADAPMRAAMLAASLLCVLLGLVPSLPLQLGAPLLRLLLPGAEGARLAGGWIGPALAPESHTAYGSLALAALVVLGFMATVVVVQRLAVPGHRRGPAWDCGYRAAPAERPWGNTAAQYTAGSFAQPILRILARPLLAASEHVEMPEPGETRPARHQSGFRDPAARFLFAPLQGVVMAIAERVNHLQFLTIRRYLALMFAALVTLLVLLAALEAR
ncbi:MAG: hydrogenase 4 subunit B, partial [Alphaproteobacteria bacterium]|nr:hydrogenase 4 subunit B [Alphaproteobacteria bacterium]